MESEPNVLTVLLTNRAPKTLDPTKWEVLIETPEANAAAQYLGVRVEIGSSRAIVYGHKGAGAGVTGAGLYAGFVTAVEGGTNYDNVAAAIFQVGDALNFDKQMLWAFVQRLPSQEL